MSGEMTIELSAIQNAARTSEVVRYEWHSAFGLVVVEVRQGQVYVNGDWVEPFDPKSLAGK